MYLKLSLPTSVNQPNLNIMIFSDEGKSVQNVVYIVGSIQVGQYRGLNIFLAKDFIINNFIHTL